MTVTETGVVRRLRGSGATVADRGMVVALTVAVTAALFALTGHDPIAVYRSMFQGALVGPGLVTTVQRTVVVVGLSLGLSFAFRAGQFNLGASGQFVLGGAAGAVVALYCPGPGWVVVPLALLAATAAGALLASVPAVLFTGLSAPVFATSLLLNYPALSLTSYLITTWLKDPSSDLEASRPISVARRIPALAPAHSELGRFLNSVFGQRNLLTLFGSELNWSLLVVVLILAAVLVIERRSALGFETGLIGLNPRMAGAVGIRTGRAIVLALALGGAIAGVMGALVVLGAHYRLIDGGLDGTGYPITALLVVMLARNSSVAVVVVGFLFTAIGVGGQEVERDYGLSSYVSTVVQALVVFLVSMRLTTWRPRLSRARKPVGEVES
ncbi:ABC transporter permease [Nocardia miyunensis]|uniref:ABC transporter permease n=1 Tax=Nocardia miyunensis TaxID=282684 RepID=UPI00082D1956|nr:ABC transporter permease [Nocardia miyunensis]